MNSGECGQSFTFYGIFGGEINMIFYDKKIPMYIATEVELN